MVECITVQRGIEASVAWPETLTLQQAEVIGEREVKKEEATGYKLVMPLADL
jgi:hypothetical protein